MQYQATRSTGTEAAADNHFPRRICLKGCCTTLFMDTVDATLARAARVFAEAVA